MAGQEERGGQDEADDEHAPLESDALLEVANHGQPFENSGCLRCGGFN
jgi:hypothetical protein